MYEIELERTFLAKEVPNGLTECPNRLIRDTYFPLESDHPSLRLRQVPDKCELTKKEPLSGSDSSEMSEHTIVLTPGECGAFSQMPGKVVEKIRYAYKFDGRVADIDVFQGELEGLILIDVEFDNVDDKNNFKMPDFCLADVTQDKFIAGGKLCGKKYDDIATELGEFGYKRIVV